MKRSESVGIIHESFCLVIILAFFNFRVPCSSEQTGMMTRPPSALLIAAVQRPDDPELIVIIPESSLIDWTRALCCMVPVSFLLSCGNI